MEERGSEAAGGGRQLKERWDRVADPACADASHAGAGLGPCPGPGWLGPVSLACADASHASAGSGPASPWRNFNPWHHSSPQGRRPDGPRTAEVEEAFMARRGFIQETHDVPGSAVDKDSDEALHRMV